MSQGHTHNHGHSPGDSCGHNHGSRRSLGLSLGLTLGFMGVEAVGGWLSNSLALLSDAGHMLTDAGALGLSLIALRLGEKSASPTKTFGYRRFEVLAALLNGLTLWAIVGLILREAWDRVRAPEAVQGAGMFAIAAAGLLVNLATIAVLHRHKDENLNLRGAFLHVVADSLGSVGALAASILILATGWTLADPLVSVAICALILWSSWGVVREALHVLLEGVPPHIDFHEVESAILKTEGVCCLYDLHIWSIVGGHEALSAHVVVPDGYERQKDLLRTIVAELRDRFGIDHATLQIEESHDLRDEYLTGTNGRCRVPEGTSGQACSLGRATSAPHSEG